MKAIINADERLAALLRHASRATLQYLAEGHASVAIAQREGEFHHGDEPLEADQAAQRVFEAAVRSHEAFEHLNIRAIVGEERIRDVPDPRDGDRVIIVDPLDGSKCWALVKTGYCVAALVLLGVAGKWTVDSAIVATPLEAYTLRQSGHVLAGPIGRDPSSDVAVMSVLPENDVLGRTLSAVAYKPDDLQTIQRLMSFLPGWQLLTFGGNPMVPQVITGGLTSVITLKPTTNWDSVGVLLASATDAVVGTHQGQRLSGPLFTDLFARVLLTGNVTPIPPLIVAKSVSAYEAIVEALENLRRYV